MTDNIYSPVPTTTTLMCSIIIVSVKLQAEAAPIESMDIFPWASWLWLMMLSGQGHISASTARKPRMMSAALGDSCLEMDAGCPACPCHFCARQLAAAFSPRARWCVPPPPPPPRPRLAAGGRSTQTQHRGFARADQRRSSPRGVSVRVAAWLPQGWGRALARTLCCTYGMVT